MLGKWKDKYIHYVYTSISSIIMYFFKFHLDSNIITMFVSLNIKHIVHPRIYQVI